jgi:hypothetical protein
VCYSPFKKKQLATQLKSVYSIAISDAFAAVSAIYLFFQIASFSALQPVARLCCFSARSLVLTLTRT